MKKFFLRQLQKTYSKRTLVPSNLHLQADITGFKSSNSYPSYLTAGFTVLEIITVVLIVAILAAIAAPGWLSFVNRQRINKANEAILNTLQEAQRQAKKTKLPYHVSFTTDSNKVIKLAIHPNETKPDNYWSNLGKDLEIKSGDFLLGTNIIHNNTKANTPSYAISYNDQKPQTITFNQTGTLAAKSNGSTPDTPLVVVVAVPNSKGSLLPGKMKRCVVISTLIGSMRTAKDQECDAALK